jgi:hypothetical protein
MTAPRISPWQLILRFALELASLVAWGLLARTYVGGTRGAALAWCVPAGLAVLWGTFAVKGDPSRSGRAPVPVPGLARLALELFVFIGAALALALRTEWIALGIFVLVFILHHAMTMDRLRWLVRQ